MKCKIANYTTELFQFAIPVHLSSGQTVGDKALRFPLIEFWGCILLKAF
jgi:hypothetical protein